MAKFESFLSKENIESTEEQGTLKALRSEIDAFVTLERKMWREPNSPKLQSKKEQIISAREAIEKSLHSENLANVAEAILLLEYLLKELPLKPHPLSDFAADIVQENLSYIVESVGRDEQSKKIIGLVTAFVESAQYGDKEKNQGKFGMGMSALEETFSREEENLFNTKDPDLIKQYGLMLSQLIERGSHATAEKATDSLGQYFSSGLLENSSRTENPLLKLFSKIDLKLLEQEQLSDDVPEVARKIHKIYVDILTRYGLKPEDFAAAWNKSVNRKEYESGQPAEASFFKNLETLRTLEEKRPGAAAVLAHEFHLMDFGRYPTEVLIQQYDMRDDQEKPYGVLLFPEDDHNGSFYDAPRPLRQLLDQMQGRYLLRIIEAGSKMDIARRLIELDRKYGSAHKIDFALVGGHADENVIVFGGDKPNQQLSMEDLLGKGVQRTSQFFEENPTVILWGCSVGKEGGLGQELSKRLDVKVIAPSVITEGITSIKVKFTDERPEFDVQFQTEGLHFFSRTKKYEGGKLQ